MGSRGMNSPDQIIAAEVGTLKSAIILAALRGQGWEIVRKNPLADEVAARYRRRWEGEIQAIQAFPY